MSNIFNFPKLLNWHLNNIFILFAFCLVNQSAYSQIIYTDVNPDDTVVWSDTYNLDINNDSVFDFIVSTPYYPHYCGCGYNTISDAVINPLNGNEILGVAGGPSYDVNALNFYDTIGVMGQVWNSDTIGIMHTYGFGCTGFDCGLMVYDGPWNYGDDKYIGLRIKNGNQFIYCWLHLQLEAPAWARPIIKEYAYNTIPDASVIAGDIPLGTSNFPETPVLKVFPNPAIDNFTLDFKLSFGYIANNNIQVRISNSFGQIVYSENFQNLDRFFSKKIKCNFPSGIYFVKLYNDDHSFIEKLIIL